MISYDEAKRIADSIAKKEGVIITTVKESEKAYSFDNPEILTFGGYPPIVVLKETGEVMGMTRYLLLYDEYSEFIDREL